MNRLIVLVTCLLLLSCSKDEQLKTTRNDPIFTVDMRIVPESEISRVCSARGVEYTANGCNVFDPNTKRCTIYVMSQRFSEDTQRLAIIGHEIWHCRYGAWHD